jgi:hypothetical protein
VPLTRRETPEGPVWVRPPYRPEDYTAPEEALGLFARWQGEPETGEAILTLRGNPFANYVEVGREIRDGETRITLLEASREFALEVSADAPGFGKVAPLPPERAYELACARDGRRSKPVLREA